MAALIENITLDERRQNDGSPFAYLSIKRAKGPDMVDQHGNKLFLTGSTWAKAILAYLTLVMFLLGGLFRSGMYFDAIMTEMHGTTQAAQAAQSAAADARAAATKNAELIQEEMRRADQRHIETEDRLRAAEMRMDRTDDQISDLVNLVNQMAAKIHVQPYTVASPCHYGQMHCNQQGR